MGKIYEDFVAYITTNHLGDVASVVAIFITIVGFVVTVYNIIKSKTAAERAEEAVTQVRGDLVRMSAVADIASTISGMEEIKRLHRQEAWDLLPERYAALRKVLIGIKVNMSNERKAILQDIIVLFRGIEKEIDLSIRSKRPPKSVPRLNDIVSKKMDVLEELLVEIRDQIGR